MDGLDLSKCGHTPGAVLDIQPTPLESPERLVRRQRDVGIHPCSVAFESAGSLGGSVLVSAPYRPTQPKMRGTGAVHGLIEITISGGAGPNCSSSTISHPIRHASQDGRREDVPRAIYWTTPSGGAPPIRQRICDELLHVLTLRLIVDGAKP